MVVAVLGVGFEALKHDPPLRKLRHNLSRELQYVDTVGCGS
jgi:hypothetical protein